MKAGLLLFSTLVPLLCHAQNYNPLTADIAALPAPLELTIHDAGRNRDIPVKIYLPTNAVPEPVVLFSPGLGGTRETDEFLGKHWAARGYFAVFLQHPGSDDVIWKNPRDLGPALRQAVSAENFDARAADVKTVLNQLEFWNNSDVAKSNQLAGRMNLKKIGMSGHSYGAITTEAVGGESFPVVGQRYTDPRITAAIAFSPAPPRHGSAAKAFADVKIPWLLMTGTKDNSPLGDMNAKDRLKVYPNLKLAPKYEVVLFDAEHSAFADRPLPGDKEPRNPNHHRVMLAVTTAFWDAYLRGDAAARAWLNSEQPRTVMETKDEWQFSLPH